MAFSRSAGGAAGDRRCPLHGWHARFDSQSCWFCAAFWSQQLAQNTFPQFLKERRKGKHRKKHRHVIRVQANDRRRLRTNRPDCVRNRTAGLIGITGIRRRTGRQILRSVKVEQKPEILPVLLNSFSATAAQTQKHRGQERVKLIHTHSTILPHAWHTSCLNLDYDISHSLDGADTSALSARRCCSFLILSGSRWDTVQRDLNVLNTSVG